MVAYPQKKFNGQAPRHSDLDHGVHVLLFQLVDFNFHFDHTTCGKVLSNK
jgi:hypothetical protein